MNIQLNQRQARIIKEQTWSKEFENKQVLRWDLKHSQEGQYNLGASTAKSRINKTNNDY